MNMMGSMGMASQSGVLWMGSLDRYMDENFIRSAFSQMGETITGVKMMKNKLSGEQAGYCFVQFLDDFSALTAMHKLNNKTIPSSQPPTKFRLNHTSLGGKQAMDKDFSLWIGDLSPDVDDYTLYRGFATRYPSLRLAKVILDANGFSKGYGFVRFADEEEQQDALLQMNGYKGIGSKAMRVSIAINRAGGQKQNNPLQGQAMAAVQAMWSGQGPQQQNQPQQQQQPQQQNDYSQYYEQYYQNYAAWQNYQQQYYDPNNANAYSYGQNAQQPPNMGGQYPMVPSSASSMNYGHPQAVADDEFELVEHSVPIDIDKLNNELVKRSNEYMDALTDSRWLPVGTLQVPDYLKE